MANDLQRRVIIIAGSNGAGKSTFAQQFLPKEANCPHFVNADLIAAGLSPFDPAAVEIRAGRLMLEELRRHAAAGESFAFETTLAGRGYARLIAQWQDVGNWVHMTFLWLPSAELAVQRVAERVAQGGHDVPEAVIRRRFDKGFQNFQDIYQKLVNSWQLYDNSGEQPILLDQFP